MFTQNQPNAQIAHHKPVFCLFGIRAHIAHPLAYPLFTVVLAAVLILPVAGCSFGSSKDKKDDSIYADQGQGVFNDTNTALDIPDTQDESIQWSIILVTLPKPEIAPQVLSNIQSKHGLLNAYITTRQDKTIIAYGKYTGNKDRQALLDLDYIHELTSNGSRPFAAAYLAPPPGNVLGGKNTEYNLRTVKERFGPAAIYTLQIGVYGNNDNQTPKPSEIKEFRHAAEQAVLELRAQGERSFYYHGPIRSTVTIGVFGEVDFDSTTTPAIESMRLKELRKRFPHNYLNGQGIRETVNSATGQRVTRLQPSSLVGVPSK